MLLIVSAAAAQETFYPVTSDCGFVANQTTPVYTDRNLTRVHVIVNAIPSGASYPVVEIYDDAALLLADFETSFWVSTENGTIFGDYCEVSTLYTAETLASTRLWSEPDVVTGQVLSWLTEGVTVDVKGSAVVGRIRYDSLQTGTWYPVSFGNDSGWVWSERLDVDTTRAPISAFALEDARVWSEPDVSMGTRLLSLNVNDAVEIIGGPVTGRLRFDGTTSGIWYQVSVNGVIGWVWENRLRFE